MTGILPEAKASTEMTHRDVLTPSWVKLDLNPDDPADVGGLGPCLSLASDKCAFNTVWSAEGGAIAYIDAVRTGNALTVYELRQIALWAETAAGLLDQERKATELVELTEQNRRKALSRAGSMAHLHSASLAVTA